MDSPLWASASHHMWSRPRIPWIGEPFASKVNQLGILLHFTDMRSPWQNARTERAGGAFKSKLETVLHETSAESELEFALAVSETQIARNRYMNRAGFSPFQRVFGTTPRLPASMFSGWLLGSRFGAFPVVVMKFDELGRFEMQQLQLGWNPKIPKRCDELWGLQPEQQTWRSLNLVMLFYVWRNVPDCHGWTGPGVVVAASENGRSLWVSKRGYLIKASREQTRAATSEESLGAELVQELSKAMLQDLESGNVSHFRDIEGEGGPDDGTAAQPLEGEPPPPLPEVPAEDEDVEMQQPSLARNTSSSSCSFWGRRPGDGCGHTNASTSRCSTCSKRSFDPSSISCTRARKFLLQLPLWHQKKPLQLPLRVEDRAAFESMKGLEVDWHLRLGLYARTTRSTDDAISFFQDQHLQHGLHHRQASISTTYFRTMTPRKCSGSTSSPERIPCLYLLTRPPMSSRMHVAW